VEPGNFRLWGSGCAMLQYDGLFLAVGRNGGSANVQRTVAIMVEVLGLGRIWVLDWDCVKRFGRW
jgi:hypothetical protein